MKQISVIVPVYNIECYLENCLMSIKNQDFDSYEVILVDDGSTDRSREIAEDFVEKNKEKFRLICQENRGLSGARNTGMKYAEGNYVCFVDSDDTIEQDYLSELYENACKHNADLVFCAFRSVDEDGRCLKNIYEENLISGKVYTLKENKNLFLIQNAAWNKLYKKELIDKYNLEFTEGVWYEDLRFTKKYLLLADKCVYCDSILYNYLQRPGSIMNSMKSERNIEILDAIEEVELFYAKHGVEKEFRHEFEIIAIDHIYISTLVRLIRSDEHVQFNKIRSSFLKKYPNHKQNEYLELLGKNRRLIYNLLNLKMYWLIKVLFAIKK